MKIILYAIYAIVGLASFAGSLALILFLSGNLNREVVDKAMGKEVEATVPNLRTEAQKDPVGSLMQEINAKREALDAREAELDQREKQLNQREDEIKKLLASVQELKENISVELANQDTERTKRIQSVAVSVGSMKSDRAAAVLQDFPPEDAAEILNLVAEKDRGKILDSMEPEFATRVLRAVQEPAV